MTAPTSNAPDEFATMLSNVEPPMVPPHRSHDPSNNMKRTDPFMFGSRYLEQGDDVYEFNAWDHVEPDDDFKEFAQGQYAKQREAPVSDYDKHRFNSDPAKWWNLFYKNNTANFFKNRKWLQQEFPVLADVSRSDAGPQVVLEVGAGAGNTAFPLLANNENEGLMVHACDFSKTAVKVMRESEHYDTKHMVADVWDVSAVPTEENDSMPPGLTEGSVDVVILIFIFSALSPTQWSQALNNIYRVLKPGGQVLFRDYGRGDLAQVRFKKGRYLDENFYIRGDGTRVYFFDREELVHMWSQWAPGRDVIVLEKESEKAGSEDYSKINSESDGVFEIAKLGIDRRLIVNRQRKLKMYRCWMQGHFKKRINSASAEEEKKEAS
ncbi:hypothetical protein ASPWEDRAFT_111852 [Aspergillus wentii DTO 134E9]|uniref:tRNA N(3)-methylcytidine methyltransferase n=1 Tax=Aspergillus wentii DTO 134E9 TaxID=1073089 RepID=A0A1L9RL31_ASPWE|nr:uncharacterized protein ASPWEDRAFT_111852 [Aspergillus wentii DTO 134E9]KAI9924591.1 Methyltransferase like [Aspergillus wentii]OJJ35645.1 hypothetical protein ASPWEDRAFT_111852 [Aspergillus wentii DTO 134E9]